MAKKRIPIILIFLSLTTFSFAQKNKQIKSYSDNLTLTDVIDEKIKKVGSFSRNLVILNRL